MCMRLRETHFPVTRKACIGALEMEPASTGQFVALRAIDTGDRGMKMKWCECRRRMHAGKKPNLLGAVFPGECQFVLSGSVYFRVQDVRKRLLCSNRSPVKEQFAGGRG